MLRSAACEPAAGLGALIRASPHLIVLIGGLSVTLWRSCSKLFPWFESSNNLGSGMVPDWTVGVAWLGIALRFRLIRTPLRCSRSSVYSDPR